MCSALDTRRYVLDQRKTLMADGTTTLANLERKWASILQMQLRTGYRAGFKERFLVVFSRTSVVGPWIITACSRNDVNRLKLVRFLVVREDCQCIADMAVLWRASAGKSLTSDKMENCNVWEIRCDNSSYWSSLRSNEAWNHEQKRFTKFAKYFFWLSDILSPIS